MKHYRQKKEKMRSLIDSFKKKLRVYGNLATISKGLH